MYKIRVIKVFKLLTYITLFFHFMFSLISVQEVIKPIVVDDNPFEKLSQLINSANSNNQDEGPAFEYPEVIRGQGQYKDSVERHINGIKDEHLTHSTKGHQNRKSYGNKNSNKHFREHSGGKVYSFGKSMSTIPFSYHKTDDYRQSEPSVLEQLARNHVNEGHPIRLSDTGSVSPQQRPIGYAGPEPHPTQVNIHPNFNKLTYSIHF